MPSIRPLGSVLLVCAVLLAASGCGQKGPLYLPDQTPPKARQTSR